MSVNQCLISVIIPVYNGGRHLAEALDSVLSQAHHPLEVIVVDDGSTDNTASIARQYSAVRYYHQANRGSAAARNRAIELAHGNLFAFLDADDAWMPGKLARQTAVLQADAGLDAVLGYAQQFLSADLPVELAARIHCPIQPQPGRHHSAMLIRRAAFLRVGLFDTSLPIGDIIEWFTRADHVPLKTRMLPDVVFRRRIHTTNMGHTNHHLRQFYVRIAKAALDRRKGHSAATGSLAE